MKNPFFLLLLFISTVNAQIVNIPDPQFKNALLNHTNGIIDTNGDGEIQVSEAQSYTGTLDVAASYIFNISGLEYFTNITALNVSQNYLENLDVAANTELVALDCSINPIVDIDLSSNTKLREFRNTRNWVESYDFSNNLELEILEIIGYSGLQIEIDVTPNVLLKKLSLQYLGLSTINLSTNTALEQLNLNENNLTSLDLSSNSQLHSIDLSFNELTELELNNHELLTDLTARYTDFTDLSFNAVSNLESIDLEGSWSLTSLNLTHASSLTFLEIQSCTSLSMQNLKFPSSLEYLNIADCYNLGSLDLSDAPNVKNLWAMNSQVAEVILPHPSLEWIYLSSDNLIALDLSNQTELLEISCYVSNLETIDVSNCSSLKKIVLKSGLKTLDVSNLPELTSINCTPGILETIITANTPSLKSIECSYNNINTFDFSLTPQLSRLICANNNLTTLDLSSTQMNALRINDNFNLTDINLQNGANWRFETNPSNFTNLPKLESVCLDQNGTNARIIPWILDQVDHEVNFYNSADCQSFIFGTSDNQENVFKLYPNPVSEILHIESTLPIQEIKIFNLNGQIVLKTPEITDGLNIAKLHRGMYFLQAMFEENRTQTIKVVKI